MKHELDILDKNSFEVDRYPHFCIDLKGTTIIGYYEDDEKFSIKLKDIGALNSVLDEWNNEVYWYKNLYNSEEIEDVKEELGII